MAQAVHAFRVHLTIYLTPRQLARQIDTRRQVRQERAADLAEQRRAPFAAIGRAAAA